MPQFAGGQMWNLAYVLRRVSLWSPVSVESTGVLPPDVLVSEAI